VPPDNQKWYK